MRGPESESEARADKAADLAVRLQKQFGAVGNAKLPELYVNAKQGLAQCVRVDECKSWADKAEAIRSYARQAGDDELMHTAMRIKGRAIQRLGDLLEDMERAGGLGGRPKNGSGAPTVSKTAKDVGLSKHQTHQAQSVSRFARSDPERFDSMVERGKPATVTELAREGRKPAPPRTEHLKGVTPNEFARTTYAMGEIGRMVEAASKIAPQLVAQTATPKEHRRLLEQTEFLARWISNLRKALTS